MTSETGSAAGNSGERPFRSGDSTSRRALEDVLKQTAALDSLERADNFAGDPADVEALLEVARRFPQADLQDEKIQVELVRSLLRRQLGQRLQSEDQLTAMSERIARTLFENPETHERLNALWARLIAVTE